MLQGKHIILGITGGIAAYKSVQILRLLRKAGAEVQVVITPAGKEFITPVTLSSLSGKPVISEFFTANTGVWNSHVDLGLWADAMVIAPATASSLAKMANGVADNMLITTYLSAKCQVFAAPAMDLDMYSHPSTQRNLRTLEQDGVILIEPADGYLASGLVGKGRMEEPEQIVKVLAEHMATPRDLEGKKILITAGPTHENIDPVRFIGNYSSGKMGYSLAARCAERGAEVWLVSGPVSRTTPAGNVHRIDVTSAREMHDACVELFPGMDAAIMCAAVADYAPAECADSKIKRESTGEITLRLVPNPDIAAKLGTMKREGQKLIGFALETNNEHAHAIDKLRRKNLDFIVLNSLRNPKAGFGVDTNQVTIISADGEEHDFPAKDKNIVATDIIDVTL
ncbi:MAG: bifunctional phosphopantothenoylcysteine decarboxylase/phosphopantothenate--cysteine ligase CoaBC [Bacteroidales bacterium]|nr:bifunctional phosphopantothenoylcysteine decarboxylase/phosphopantothenate--cysteine ligase CoaBC [Bacteroidales bacterium]